MTTLPLKKKSKMGDNKQKPAGPDFQRAKDRESRLHTEQKYDRMFQSYLAHQSKLSDIGTVLGAHSKTRTGALTLTSTTSTGTGTGTGSGSGFSMFAEDLDSVYEDLTELGRRNESLHDQLAVVSKAKVLAQLEAATARQEIVAQKQRDAAKDMAIAALRQQLADLEARATASERRVQDFEMTLQIERKALEEERIDNETLRQTIEKERDQSMQAAQEMQTQKQQMQHMMRQDLLAQQQSHAAQLIRALENKQREMAAASQAAEMQMQAALTAALQEAADERSRLRAELQKQSDDRATALQEALGTALAEAKQMKKDHKAEMEALQRNSDDALKQVQAERREKADMQEQLKEAGALQAQYKADIARLVTDLKSADARLQSEKAEAAREELVNEMARQWRQQTNEMRVTIQQQLEALQTLLPSGTLDFASLKEALAKQKQEQDSKIQQLESDVAALRIQAEAKEQERREEELKISDLERQAEHEAQAQTEIAALTSVIKQLEIRVVQAEQETKTKAQETETIKKSLTAADAYNTALTHRAEKAEMELRTQQASYERSIARTTNQIQELEKSLSASAKETDAANNKVQRLAAYIEQQQIVQLKKEAMAREKEMEDEIQRRFASFLESKTDEIEQAMEAEVKTRLRKREQDLETHYQVQRDNLEAEKELLQRQLKQSSDMIENQAKELRELEAQLTTLQGALPEEGFQDALERELDLESELHAAAVAAQAELAAEKDQHQAAATKTEQQLQTVVAVAETATKEKQEALAQAEAAFAAKNAALARASEAERQKKEAETHLAQAIKEKILAQQAAERATSDAQELRAQVEAATAAATAVKTATEATVAKSQTDAAAARAEAATARAEAAAAKTDAGVARAEANAAKAEAATARAKADAARADAATARADAARVKADKKKELLQAMKELQESKDALEAANTRVAVAETQTNAAEAAKDAANTEKETENQKTVENLQHLLHLLSITEVDAFSFSVQVGFTAVITAVEKLKKDNRSLQKTMDEKDEAQLEANAQLEAIRREQSTLTERLVAAETTVQEQLRQFQSLMPQVDEGKHSPNLQFLMQKLQQQQKQQRTQINDLEKQLRDIVFDNEGLEEKIQEIQAKKKKYKVEIMARKIGDQRQISALEAQISELQKRDDEMARLGQRIIDLEEELRQKESSNGTLQAELREGQRKLEEMVTLQEANHSLTEAIQAENRRLQAEGQKKLEEMSTLQQQQEQQRTQINDLEGQLQDIVLDKEGLKKRIQEIQAKKKKYKAEIMARKIGDQQQISALEAQISEEKARLGQRIIDLEEELRQKESSNGTLQAEMQEAGQRKLEEIATLQEAKGPGKLEEVMASLQEGRATAATEEEEDRLHDASEPESMGAFLRRMEDRLDVQIPEFVSNLHITFSPPAATVHEHFQSLRAKAIEQGRLLLWADLVQEELSVYTLTHSAFRASGRMLELNLGKGISYVIDKPTNEISSRSQEAADAIRTLWAEEVVPRLPKVDDVLRARIQALPELPEMRAQTALHQHAHLANNSDILGKLERSEHVDSSTMREVYKQGGDKIKELLNHRLRFIDNVPKFASLKQELQQQLKALTNPKRTKELVIESDIAWYQRVAEEYDFAAEFKDSIQCPARSVHSRQDLPLHAKTTADGRHSAFSFKDDRVATPQIFSFGMHSRKDGMCAPARKSTTTFKEFIEFATRPEDQQQPEDLYSFWQEFKSKPGSKPGGKPEFLSFHQDIVVPPPDDRTLVQAMGTVPVPVVGSVPGSTSGSTTGSTTGPRSASAVGPGSVPAGSVPASTSGPRLVSTPGSGWASGPASTSGPGFGSTSGSTTGSITGPGSVPAGSVPASTPGSGWASGPALTSGPGYASGWASGPTTLLKTIESEDEHSIAATGSAMDPRGGPVTERDEPPTFDKIVVATQGETPNSRELMQAVILQNPGIGYKRFNPFQFDSPTLEATLSNPYFQYDDYSFLFEGITAQTTSTASVKKKLKERIQILQDKMEDEVSDLTTKASLQLRINQQRDILDKIERGERVDVPSDFDVGVGTDRKIVRVLATTKDEALHRKYLAAVRRKQNDEEFSINSMKYTPPVSYTAERGQIRDLVLSNLASMSGRTEVQQRLLETLQTLKARGDKMEEDLSRSERQSGITLLQRRIAFMKRAMGMFWMNENLNFWERAPDEANQKFLDLRRNISVEKYRRLKGLLEHFQDQLAQIESGEQDVAVDPSKDIFQAFNNWSYLKGLPESSSWIFVPAVSAPAASSIWRHARGLPTGGRALGRRLDLFDEEEDSD